MFVCYGHVPPIQVHNSAKLMYCLFLTYIGDCSVFSVSLNALHLTATWTREWCLFFASGKEESRLFHNEMMCVWDRKWERRDNCASVTLFFWSHERTQIPPTFWTIRMLVLVWASTSVAAEPGTNVSNFFRALSPGYCNLRKDLSGPNNWRNLHFAT